MMQNMNKGLSETLTVQDDYISRLDTESENIMVAIERKEIEREKSLKKDTIEIETLKSIEGLRAELKYKDIFIEKKFKNYY